MDAYQVIKDVGAPTGALIVVCYVLYLIVTRLIPSMIETQGKVAEAQGKSTLEKFDALIGAFKQGVLGVDNKIDDVSEKIDKNHGEVVSWLDKIDGKLPESKHKKDAGGV